MTAVAVALLVAQDSDLLAHLHGWLTRRTHGVGRGYRDGMRGEQPKTPSRQESPPDQGVPGSGRGHGCDMSPGRTDRTPSPLLSPWYLSDFDSETPREVDMPACEICDTDMPPQAVPGRPRRYCSPRCKGNARVFAETEVLIARARERGADELAEQRAAWLADARADARNGWAAANARVAAINRRIREHR